MDNSSITNEGKEELLLEAVRIQHSIIQLLDNTLLDLYKSEKELPEDQQNEEVLNLAYNVRNIVGKKPKLKEIYKKLEEDYHIDLSE